MMTRGRGAADYPKKTSASLPFRDAVLAKFGKHVDVQLAFERDDQFGQPIGHHPLPSIEFRVLGCKVDIRVAPSKAHSKPFLPLTAVLAAPDADGELLRQIVCQPSAAFAEYLCLRCADLLLELT